MLSLTISRFPRSMGEVCPALRTASFAAAAHLVPARPHAAVPGGNSNGTTLAFAATQHREAPW